MGGQAEISSLITVLLILISSMPQGGMKKKVSVPPGTKQKQNHDKLGVMKKGKRQIAPAKNRIVNESNLKRGLTQAINKKIEDELTAQANTSELKQLTVLKRDTKSLANTSRQSKSNKKK